MLFLFDLDGPLLDVSEKYYCLYTDLLAQEGFAPLSKSEYWEAKRAKTDEKTILSRSGAESFYDSYTKQRLALIETDRYLNLDSIQENAIEILEKLYTQHRLVLVTLRSKAELAHKQLRRLGLYDYFEMILSSGEELAPRWKIKEKLVRQALGPVLRVPAVFIGDTETDIGAGKALGCVTVGVENGIRNSQLVSRYAPTHQIHSVKSLEFMLPRLIEEAHNLAQAQSWNSQMGHEDLVQLLRPSFERMVP